jgi:hypothetical protein
MGAVFGIPQPEFRINALGWKYRVIRDDLVNGFEEGEVVIPVSYRVLHGMSSMTANSMYLQTQDGRYMPVQIFDRKDSISKNSDDYYFVAIDYPTYDACKYREEGYDLELEFTPRLQCIQ